MWYPRGLLTIELLPPLHLLFVALTMPAERKNVPDVSLEVARYVLGASRRCRQKYSLLRIAVRVKTGGLLTSVTR